MKNKPYDVRLHPVAGLLFLLAGVVLLSWIADCYGWYVVYTATGEEIRLQNLLIRDRPWWLPWVGEWLCMPLPAAGR